MKKFVDKFYYFASDQISLFVVIFATLCCLLITPINFKIINPIEKTFNIPAEVEVQDKECSGFGIMTYSCKTLETTHMEPTRPITFICLYLIQFCLFAGLGYSFNKFIIKKLS